MMPTEPSKTLHIREGRSMSVLALALWAMFLPAARGWTMGSAVSGFSGSVLLVDRPSSPSSSPSPNSNPSFLTMKKGKANVPPQMRGQYEKQKEMMAQREAMIAATKPGADGFPVFNLFVRTKRANMWYPCGSFKGDDRSLALAKNYANGGLLAGVSKKQIDTGIASSLFRDKGKLSESICRAYPQLRKSIDEFEFGYKLAFEGLSEAQAAEIKAIEPKESNGIIDNVKNLFT